MKHAVTQRHHGDQYNRAAEVLIDGAARVTLRQCLKSPVDFKPEAPVLHWTAPGGVDAEYAEAMAEALRQAAAIFRAWEAATTQMAA